MTWREMGVKWMAVLNAAEKQYGIPEDLLARQCYQESHFNTLARNPSGAIGLMQLLPKYFPGAGEDPAKDILTAAKYMQSLYKRFSDWQLALAAYDWGPSALAKWIKDGRKLSLLPKETHDYVTEIITDIPVEGSLCRTPSLQLVGYPTDQSTVVRLSAPLPHKSLWQSVTGIFTRPSVQNLPPQLPRSVSPQQGISLQTANQGVNSMSNPAAPALIEVLKAIEQFVVNLGTDPAQLAVKFPGALAVLMGTVEMQLPVVAVAELGALQTAISARIAAAIASLQAP